MILYCKLRPYLDKVLIAESDGVSTSEIVPFLCLINSAYLIIFFKSPTFFKQGYKSNVWCKNAEIRN